VLTKLQKKTSPASARALAARGAGAVPLVLSLSLLAAPGCTSWRPLGSNNITFDQEHLAGQPLRITHEGKSAEMRVVDVRAPFILVETDELDGEKRLVPVYLHPAYKVEVRAPDPKKKRLIGGLVGGVGGAVLAAVLIGSAMAFANRSISFRY